jgi:hypothetical protein
MTNSFFNLSDLGGKIPKKKIEIGLNLGRWLSIKIGKISGINIEAKIQRAVNRASDRIAVDLKRALDDALHAGWPFNDGTRDIYETGELLESGRVEVTANGISIVYDAPYASLVRYGGYIHPYGNTNLSVYLPARPWIDAVVYGGGPVRKFDFLSYYREEIIREFS